ncbi:MAG: hypothetical protein ACR2JW_21925 [Thermomicrobiales bacterium]
MVRQNVAITTNVTSVVGPYQGRRISGTSQDVVEVIIATLYDFGDFSVYVADIPARLDQGTGSYYLHGPVALRINNKVNEIIEEVQRKQQAEPDMLQRDTPLTFELKAPDFLTDAA